MTIDDQNDSIIQSESFRSKIKITWETPTDGNTKKIEIRKIPKIEIPK